jgi:hypothetical protein
MLTFIKIWNKILIPCCILLDFQMIYFVSVIHSWAEFIKDDWDQAAVCAINRFLNSPSNTVVFIQNIASYVFQSQLTIMGLSYSILKKVNCSIYKLGHFDFILWDPTNSQLSHRLATVFDQMCILMLDCLKLIGKIAR